MIRVVSLPKAAFAGVCGAAATESFFLLAERIGLPTVDLVAQLSSVQFQHSAVLAELIALGFHLFIGICWAMFYAFFFWGRMQAPPPIQGACFALIPAALAIFIVYPELTLMRLSIAVVALDVRRFWAPLSPSTGASLLASHVLFGLVLGAIYRRPVGYPVGRSPAPPAIWKRREEKGRRAVGSAAFMFATGIECSYPTICGGKWRRDEMDSTRHYERWQQDFALAREVGITHIRYGPPLHLVFAAPGTYRWEYIDPQMRELERHGPEPIIDLCHFGLPLWLGNFQNPDIGAALAEYAGAFTERFPWVRFYTPVNEMYVCARMSALNGLWNEQLQDEGAFAKAAWNLANASVQISNEILKQRPDAILINGESSEFYQPCCPDPKVQAAAEAANERRFLPLDLIFAHPLGEHMRDLLRSQGISQSDMQRFATRDVPRRSILGIDYYEWNERLIDSDGNPRALGELFGWYVIASQYWRRYKRPMMHTETNKMDSNGAARWLWRQWHNVQLLAKSGVPLVGFTWYSLIDQIDWSIAIHEPIGLLYPVGMFDLNREPRLVAMAYKHLIELYRDQPGFAECPALKALMQ